jgi:SAM-dependent methyltransferase
MQTKALFDRYYYSNPAFRDGTKTFHRLCARHFPAGARILEIGPGPRNKTSDFLSSFVEVVGVDVSPEIQANPALAAAYVYDGRRLPFRDRCFDGCVSNYVAEHLTDPESHFREVARVLRPGGVYCLRTPNLWHYVTIGSRLLPHRFHLRWANRLRSLPEAHEPYPAYYRLNTGSKIVRSAQAAGLQPVRLDYIEAEPFYGRCHPALFYPMMLYERLVNAAVFLAPFRMNILAVVAKTA